MEVGKCSTPLGKEATKMENEGKTSPSSTNEYKQRIPYPARLNHAREKEQFGKFLDLFKQLHINIPFVEALSQMPKYAKFLKELLSNKRKLEDVSTIEVGENC